MNHYLLRDGTTACNEAPPGDPWALREIDGDHFRTTEREHVDCLNCRSSDAWKGSSFALSSRTIRGGENTAYRSVTEDSIWLRDHGEDFASLRGLVEAVDAMHEKHIGDDKPPDSRAKFVNIISSYLQDKCEQSALLQDRVTELAKEKVCLEKGVMEYSARADELELRVAELTDDAKDPDENAVEDVPFGGLSHQDAHLLIGGVEATAERLEAKDLAWPDDARKLARFLRTLIGK